MKLKTLQLALFVSTSALLTVNSTATPPPVPSNIKSVVLPAEVLLRWDPSPGADYYRVYLGGPDRRWIPLPDHLREPTFRDTDFTELPSWYQIGAYNNAGESSFTEPFSVFASSINTGTDFVPYGITVRPISDTAVAINWTIFGPFPSDGTIEIGPSLTNLTTLGYSAELARRHEFVISNLQPESNYFYRLTSVGAFGTGCTYWNRFSTRSFMEPPPQLADVTIGNDPVVFTDEDNPVPFTLTARSNSGAPLSYRIFQNQYSLYGDIFGSAPNLTYRPAPDSYGAARLDLSYSDGVQEIWTYVRFQTRPVNDPPIARDFSLNFLEDSPRRFFLSAFDFDSPILGYVIISGPTNGTLPAYSWLLRADEFQYEPRTNFFGIDHITYAAYDGINTGNVATIRIRVSPVPDAPVAGQLSLVVTQSTGLLAFTLPGFDPDDLPGRPSIVFSISSPALHGRAQLLYQNSSSGEGRYLPDAGYAGIDGFNYTISDGLRFATGTVSILVVANNNPPVAYSQTISTEFGVSVPVVLSATDSDGDALSFRLLTNPTHGTVSGANPNLTYTPEIGFSGTDAFTFAANDGRDDSTAASLSVMVGASNAPPTLPTGLMTSVLSRSQINLSWQDNSQREKESKIERSGDGQTWKEIGRVAANITTYLDKEGLKPQRTYQYRVRASSKQGNSGYSNVSTATTPP
jgi:hypothetical protein